jgi:hypothetical protein
MSQATREKYNLPPLHVSASVSAASARRPTWDAARGVWLLDGKLLEPQPAPPTGLASEPVTLLYHQAEQLQAPPAVKVSA